MSLLFAAIVGLFLSFFPVIMNVYYKSGSGVTVINGLLCIIGYFSFGIGTLIAMIVAMVSVGFLNTIKSLLFAIVSIFLSVAFFAAELSAFTAIVTK